MSAGLGIPWFTGKIGYEQYARLATQSMDASVPPCGFESMATEDDRSRVYSGVAVSHRETRVEVVRFQIPPPGFSFATG
jgi:hypothetical protein